MKPEDRQAAAQDVQRRMFDFLLHFEPAQDLRVGDVKCIANFARTLVFDALAGDY